MKKKYIKPEIECIATDDVIITSGDVTVGDNTP